jgi:energy-coupling factor transporter ATP-binding protein EcfA2
MPNLISDTELEARDEETTQNDASAVKEIMDRLGKIQTRLNGLVILTSTIQG